MADWLFLDHQTRFSPSEEVVASFAKDLLSEWVDEAGAIQEEEKALLSLFDAADYAITPTSSGESHMEKVLLSHCVDYVRETGKTHVLIPANEVGAVPKALGQFSPFELEGRRVPVNGFGQLTAEALEGALTPRSGLLSLSLVHPFSGVIQPIQDLSRVCQEKGVRLHVDITHALGHFPVLCSDALPDFFTFDGRGVNFFPGFGLILSRGVLSSSPLNWGPGRFSPAHYRGLRKCILSALERGEMAAWQMSNLRDRFEEQLRSMGALPLFSEAARIPVAVTSLFPGVHGQLLAFSLARQGVFTSEGEGELALALAACGIEGEASHTGISFFFSPQVTEKEVDRLALLCAPLFHKLRALGGKSSARI